jgi:hypothetical protein
MHPSLNWCQRTWSIAGNALWLDEQRSWTMFPQIDRVYVNALARRELGWPPVYDFQHVLNCLKAGQAWRSPLGIATGSKGYQTAPPAEDPIRCTAVPDPMTAVIRRRRCATRRRRSIGNSLGAEPSRAQG